MILHARLPDLRAGLRIQREEPAGNGREIGEMAAHVPGTATSCTGATFDTTLWHIPDVTSAAPFTESFPTPLQWTPPAGTKACLFAHNLGGPTVTVNAVGFVGG